MECFNNTPFILQCVCPPLHEAVKPQAELLKIKPAELKPSPSALVKLGSVFQVTPWSPIALHKAVALCGAGTPALQANYPSLCFSSSVCSGHVSRGKFQPVPGSC